MLFFFDLQLRYILNIDKDVALKPLKNKHVESKIGRMKMRLPNGLCLSNL